jgi:cytochrome c oxidase assembly protein subunit 11
MSAQAAANTRTLKLLLGIVVMMGALAWASVPFYRWFCQVTGYGGTTNVAKAGSDVILDETMLVRFDANTAPGMPWTFKPTERSMTIRIGETGLAFYEAHNPTDQPVAGTAVFNVAPNAAGNYFTKIDCFCFELQVLQPGETVLMPVSYFVDPAIKDDPDARKIQHITLSYTFYQTDMPKEEARLLEGGADSRQRTTN